MAYRTDLPRIHTTESPSMLNRELGIGAYLGSLAAGVVTAFALAATSAPFLSLLPVIATANLAGMVIGGVIGANKGKERQIAEQKYGRMVKEPGYWNAGIVNGLVAASLITVPLALMGIFVPLLNLSLAVVAPITGSIMRKNSLDRDLETAIRLQEQERNVDRIRSQDAGSGAAIYKDSVSAQEAALLEEKLAAKTAGHVAEQAQRDASAGQVAQPARA